jgi:hypothetical protein
MMLSNVGGKDEGDFSRYKEWASMGTPHGKKMLIIDSVDGGYRVRHGCHSRLPQ